MIPERWNSAVWLACAIAIFSAATFLRYAPVIDVGLRDAIPSMQPLGVWRSLVQSDQQWVVWVVSSNARRLLASPATFYDAEQCFPEERSLAFGEPAIAMGVVAAPMRVVTRDPVLIYNLVMLAMSLGAALAMYWLVVEWTGVPAAGVAAGLLFALHGFVLKGILHPYSSDTTWLVLALVFANRWLERGRWRDAVPLAFSAAIQMATAFYSMVAALLIAIPFVLERLARRRGAGVHVGQLTFLVVVALAVALFVYGPYVRLETSGVFESRRVQFFMPLREYLPGGIAFFGFIPLLLVAVGLVAPAARTLVDGQRELRPGIAIGAVLALWVAGGPGGPLGIDLFGALSDVLPGFDSVRVPLKIAIGVHVASSIAAGFGVAACVRSFDGPVRRYIEVASIALVLAVGAVGLSTSDRTVLRVRPAEPTLTLFAELARDGNDGPLYEIPMTDTDHQAASIAAAGRILLSAYHGRSTSACYPSQTPESQYELASLYLRLPAAEAFDELKRLGFTTLVTHPPNREHSAEEAGVARRKSAELRALAEREGSPIRLLGEAGEIRAYEIVGADVEDGTAPPP